MRRFEIEFSEYADGIRMCRDGIKRMTTEVADAYIRFLKQRYRYSDEAAEAARAIVTSEEPTEETSMTSQNALVVRNEPTAEFLPAMTIEDAIERRNAIVEFTKRLMVKGTDYGVIPGTDKPTLLKPGAEKLCTLFGLSARFSLVERAEDWTGKEHGGEPFFYYLYRCQLYRRETMLVEASGSCNSWEARYRWRSAQRVCPRCKQPAIIQGKAEYGGGFVCFKKKNGCGAKFRDDDPVITSQHVGKVPNEAIFDQVNTLQKMAEKRSLIGAVLLAVNASEFFTQDLEDMTVIDVDYEVSEEPHQARTNKPSNGDHGAPITPDATRTITKDQWSEIGSLLRQHDSDHLLLFGALRVKSGGEIPVMHLESIKRDIAAGKYRPRCGMARLKRLRELQHALDYNDTQMIGYVKEYFPTLTSLECLEPEQADTAIKAFEDYQKTQATNAQG